MASETSERAAAGGDRPEGDPPRPEALLRQLADREAIAALLHEYCYACDRNDPAAVGACFTADCAADYGPDARQPGAAARRAQAERDLALFAATSHHLSGIVVEFETPDRALARSTVLAWHRPRQGPPWTLHAQYHDTVVRTDRGWLIAARRLLVADAEPPPSGWRFNPLDRA